MIGDGSPISLTIGLTSLVLATNIGLGLGALAALNQNRPREYLATALAGPRDCRPGGTSPATGKTRCDG
jgi:ABC-type dipeptide/oligopeptide/nickel transport system permease component